ncbi:hypothetical protein CDV31_000375 [Fusarium ambrosium]|uniref:Uncharacterized protein n=1 Tax=Fusarium ambrosium TaxID=131363 RepID=A0A428V2C8_9HYPO|nr:hypothetical protein CDV31_000375 [Fusarium ambrosium]
MDKDKAGQTEPGRLEGPWSCDRLLGSFLDLTLATAALLFILFGGMIFMKHETSAAQGSTGKLLLDMSKYGPTVFPVLFAAIVGAALKTFATWRLQNGTRIGLIEQLVGSHTVAEAFFTQYRLKAVNILAIAILLLWCLSPLGSQAALRAISTTQAFRNSTSNLTVLETFSRFTLLATENNLSYARRMLIPPAVASMLSARLLQDRNQDIWGNIRVPLIERLTDDISDTRSNVSGGQTPTIVYFVEPFNVLSTENKTEAAALPRATFETRLAHLINSELLLGIQPGDVAGGLTKENANNVSVNVVEMDTYIREEIVQYNKLWLTMLLASSMILFGVAMAAIVVRFRILVPEVLGSLALGMLDNRCDDIKHSSFMSGDDKMSKMKEVKVMLGDVEPHAEIGRIALAAPMEDVVVGKVQKGKFYL